MKRSILMRLAAVAAAVVPAHLCPAVPLRGLISIDLTADGQYAVIAGRKDHSIAIVDLSQAPYTVTNLYQADGIGQRPIKVRCFGPTAVVVNEHDTRLTLVDVPAATVVGDVPTLMYSQDVVWDPPRARYYISNHWKDRVYVRDADWNEVPPAEGIAVGRMPGPMTLGPDGRLYVGNRGSWDVSVVDPDFLQEIARVDIGSRPEELAATPTAVLVTNHGGQDLPRLNGVPLIDNDQTDIVNTVTEIDPVTLQGTPRFIDRGADYTGLNVRAGLVVFAGAADGSVHAHRLGDPPDALMSVDLLEDETLPGGFAPSGLRIFTNTRDAVARLPDQILAINFLRDTLAEVWVVGDTLQVQGETALNAAGVPIQAFQPAPAINFTPVQNGERYFHTLSAWRREQTDFSCSTCHPDGHSDFRMIFNDVPDPHSPGQTQGAERHPTARFTLGSAPFAWEGTLPSLFEFNLEALDTHDNPPNTGLVHGDVAEFLAIFEGTLVAGPNPNPPNNPAGQALFEGAAGCSGCHPAPLFTDNGLHNVGTGRTLNTPTLLGVWDQAHLLHDGRAATLEDVFDPAIYDGQGTPHGALAGLSAAEVQDLSDYVRGLQAADPCTADFDGDGMVGAPDLALLLGGWGFHPGHPADLNDDDFVNAADLALLLGEWGGCL